MVVFFSVLKLEYYFGLTYYYCRFFCWWCCHRCRCCALLLVFLRSINFWDTFLVYVRLSICIRLNWLNPNINMSKLILLIYVLSNVLSINIEYSIQLIHNWFNFGWHLRSNSCMCASAYSFIHNNEDTKYDTSQCVCKLITKHIIMQNE